MNQDMIAALLAVAVVAMALLAVLRLMKPKQMTLPDYPELPAPPKDDGAGEPAIREAARARKQRSLRADGARWLADGTTSLAELVRVTRDE